MSEYTKGPWSVNTHPHYDNGKPGTIWGPEGPGHGAICNMSPIYPHDFNEANARLIAAAPDLLKLTESVIGFCVNARQTWPCWEQHEDIGILYALAKTVVSKIKGSAFICDMQISDCFGQEAE